MSGQITGSNTVRSNHKIFDDLPGPVLLFDFQTANLISIKYRFGLDRFQTESSLRMPEVFQLLGNIVLQTQILGQTTNCGDF